MGPTTKPASDRTADRIGLDWTVDRIGSDWYFRFWCRRIILRKAVTQVARNKKPHFSQQVSNL